MCGIFGLVPQAGEGRASAREHFEHLALLSESRGREAAGFSVFTGSDLLVFRSPTSWSELLETSEYRAFWSRINTADILALLGHSRLVTDGSEFDPRNNQPILKGSVTGVHNGIIVNADELWKGRPDLSRSSDVDSEVFFALIDDYLTEDGDLSRAYARLYSEIDGAAATATIFAERDLLALATNNGSLYHSNSRTCFTFASEETFVRRHLERMGPVTQPLVTGLAPGVGVAISLRGLASAQGFSLSLSSPESVESRPHAREVQIRNVSLQRNRQEAVSGDNPFNRAEVQKTAATLDLLPAEWVRDLPRCSKCILPVTMPFIEFDSLGVCNYCAAHLPHRVLGLDSLGKALAQQRTSTVRSARYLVAVSGGRDSSYGLHILRQVLDLDVIAYTYDWGMVTDLARRNISRMCGRLGVEHLLVSADIRKKRANIAANLSAWLRQPQLATVPLLMAGDKEYFAHATRIQREYDLPAVFFCGNRFEKTYFKSGFAGVFEAPSQEGKWRPYDVPGATAARLAGRYAWEFARNPWFLNRSLLDTLRSFRSAYVAHHGFLWLYDYVDWEEDRLVAVLRDEYDWEDAPDTDSTWRIGDGTSAFYNYVYFVFAGLSENDTFLSNLIRDGRLTRAEALVRLETLNRPRAEGIAWYCSSLGLDAREVIRRVNQFEGLNVPRNAAGGSKN